MENTLYAGFWESLRVMALFLQQSSFLDRLWMLTFASSLRLFSPCDRRVFTPSSLLSPTPLHCGVPHFPRLPIHRRVGTLLSPQKARIHRRNKGTSTARLQMEMEDRRAGHRGGRGGQDAANQLNFSKRNESADNAPEACARRYAIADAMAAWETLLVA